jgi:DNA modification methylase
MEPERKKQRVEPRFEDAFVRMEQICGLDLLKATASNSIDLILVDPPYIISKQSGMQVLTDKIKNKTAGKTEEQWDTYQTKRNWDSHWQKYDIQEPEEQAKYMQRYKKNYLSTGHILGSKYATKTNFGSWDSNFTEEKLSEFIQEYYRVLRKGGTVIIFYDLWKITPLKKQLEDVKFKQVRFLEWIKTNPMPLNSRSNYLSNAREIALSAVKGGKPTFNTKYHNGQYREPIASGKDRFHPTQKPLKLFKQLIQTHSNPGDTIMDTFSGSGTTAMAVKKLNGETGETEECRCFIGSELHKEFYDKSIARLS